MQSAGTMMESNILCTEENITVILERTKDENINIERNFMVDWMRYWAEILTLKMKNFIFPTTAKNMALQKAITK
jgi:hypothetical protein